MKKKLLIIDDDPRNIFALVHTLQVKGFKCLSCSSAEEALQILKTTTQIDAILVDMMMPEMDGYEAIPLIRELPHRASVYILAVTAQAMKGDREKCLKAGATDYISKPVDVDLLLAKLNT